MIPVNNNGRLLLLVETPSNSQVRTSRAVTGRFIKILNFPIFGETRESP